jgi:hypothetical protein
MFETKYPDYLKTTPALSNTYVPQTTKVNGHALSDNVTVTRSDLGLGSSATLDAGSAVGNVPVVGTALGTTNGNILMTDTNGKLKPSGITTGTSAGNIPLIGTALGTTNNNIVVTDANRKLKPSGTTIGSAAGKTAGRAAGNVPLIGAALGTTDNTLCLINASGQLKPNTDTDTNTIANLKTYIRNQNLLSDYEQITLSTSSTSPTTMNYDGFITMTGYTGANPIIHINGIIIVNSYDINEPKNYTVIVKKGDKVYVGSAGAGLQFMFAGYKSRDYTGR